MFETAQVSSTILTRLHLMQSFWATVKFTAKLFSSQRKLWIPFLVTALAEAVLILALWLAPQSPLSKLLAPPLRYFFGERVLHYPAHLWFLYHAMKHTHIIASTIVGAFFTGVACVMVRQVRTGQPISLRQALVGKEVPYGRVTCLWLLTWGVATGLTEGMLHALPTKTLWMFWLVVAVTLFLQTLFVYTIPAAVFERVTWWKTLLRAVSETVRYPLSTFLLVAIPTSLIVLFAMMAPETRVAHWMEQKMPEIVIVFVAARLFVWTLTDAVLTVAVAHLWWSHRATNPAPQPALSAAPTLRKQVTPHTRTIINKRVVA